MSLRILVVDRYGGDGVLDFILRCQDAGHQVKHYFPIDDKSKMFGKGLADIVPAWEPWVKWSNLVFVTDNVKYLYRLDQIRSSYPDVRIVGPTLATAAWELQRNEGMRVFKKHGIEVPPYREFSDYDSAIAYVKKEGRAFVSKPCGDEPDKSLSYVAKSPADLIYMLCRWKESKRHKGSFILQEKVDGIEMAVGGWFGPGGFNQGWCQNWEEKKLMVGGLGPNTGEMGTTVVYTRKCKLADKVLAPLAETLEKMSYVGYIDVNCIIDEAGTPWPLEFTMRPGWPTFNIQQRLHDGDPAQWLMDLTEGRDSRSFALDRIAVGAVVALPDFPYSKFTGKDVWGVPIYGLKPDLMEQIHPCEMMQGEVPQDVNGKVVTMPCLVTAGDYVLVASGTGDSVSEARRKAYQAIGRLKIPNSPFWRKDIGLRLSKELPILQAKGYAAGLSF